MPDMNPFTPLLGGMMTGLNYNFAAWKILLCTFVEKGLLTSQDALKMTVDLIDEMTKAADGNSAAEPTERFCRDLERLAAEFGKGYPAKRTDGV